MLHPNPFTNIAVACVVLAAIGALLGHNTVGVGLLVGAVVLFVIMAILAIVTENR